MLESNPSSPGTGTSARTRARWLEHVGLGLFALLVLFVHLELTVRRSDRPLLTHDSAEYALAGRHLLRTGTLATWFVHPDELSRPMRPPFPLVVGQPLVPILNAAAFAVGGARPASTLFPAGLAYLLLAVCAAALARRLTGSPRVGLAAGAAVALSPQVLFFASEGLSEIPFAAATMAALVLLWDLPRRPRPFVLGLLLGLAHLTRPIVVPLLPAWLLGVWLATNDRARPRTLATVLAGFLACAIPLALYKLVAAGNPFADVGRFNLLSYLAPEFAPERVHRMLAPPSPLHYVVTHPGAVLAKVAHYGPAMALGAFGQAGLAVALLSALYLTTNRERDDRPVQATWIASLAILVVLVTVSLPNRRYLFPLQPALIVFAIVEVQRLAQRFPASPAVTTAVLAALVAFGPALGTLRLWGAAWRTGVSDRGGFSESEWRALGEDIGHRLPEGAAVASDIGPQLAWYAERAAVLIPNTPDELPALEQRLPLDAIVLTNHWLIGQPGSEPWRALFFARRSLAGWSRVDSVEAGRLRAVLFEHRRGTASPTWNGAPAPNAADTTRRPSHTSR